MDVEVNNFIKSNTASIIPIIEYYSYDTIQCILFRKILKLRRRLIKFFILFKIVWIIHFLSRHCIEIYDKF